MNSQWQDFLQQQGATINGGIVQHFGDPATERIASAQSSILCDLNQFGILRIAGTDAQAFLQSLLSNDIREVNDAQAQRSSLSTAKGRLLATLLVWHSQGNYFLQLPHSIAPSIQKKLTMYVLRSKVVIDDVSDELITLGVSGSAAGNAMHSLVGTLPASTLACSTSPNSLVVKVGDMRYQLYTHREQAEHLWQSMSAQAKPVGSPCWEWLDVRAGIPAIVPQTQEQFVPQMVNLDVLGGISFKKGCYPGQEIVARTHYLGKLKRRMYLAHIETTEPPQAGDELFSDDLEGQASGMIANAAPSPHGGYDILAVIQSASQAAHTIHWRSPSGAPLQFSQQPYALTLD